jgi:hypothetical protein
MACQDCLVRGEAQSRRVVRRLPFAVGLVALAVTLGAGVAQGERIQSGDLVVSLSGEIAPHALPRTTAVPVRIHVEAMCRPSAAASLRRCAS